MNVLSIPLPSLQSLGSGVGEIYRYGGRSICLFFLVLAGLAVGVGVRPAAAQIGFPVTDPSNAAQEAALVLWQEWLKDDAVDKLNELYKQHRRLEGLDWRDVELELRLLEIAAEADEAFAYGLSDLEARLRAHFPGTEGFSTSTLEGIRQQAERHLQTTRNHVQTYRRQYELVRDSRQRIEAYWSDLQGVVGEQQAYDLLLAMGVLEGEELTLARQLLAQDLLLTITTSSGRASDKALRIRTLTQGITGPRP